MAKENKKKELDKNGITWRGKKYSQDEFLQMLMMDAEYVIEHLPYLEKDDTAKLGFDPNLFDLGKVKPGEFKPKLLNIKTNLDEWLNLPEDKYTNVAATYDPETDETVINKRGSFYYTLPDEKGISYLKEGKKQQIKAGIHEARHRGGKFLNRLHDNRGKFQEVDSHWNQALADQRVAQKLGILNIGRQLNKNIRTDDPIPQSSGVYGDITDDDHILTYLDKRNKRRIREQIEDKPEIFRAGGISRYPSMLKKKGGKVLTKKRRRTKPKGVGAALRGYGRAMK